MPTGLATAMTGSQRLDKCSSYVAHQSAGAARNKQVCRCRRVKPSTLHLASPSKSQEGKWIHNLLCELLQVVGIAPPDLVIFEDNQSCIKMTKNPVNHGRAKHIDIKYHHIRDEVKRGLVQVEYKPTDAMLADLNVTHHGS